MHSCMFLEGFCVRGLGRLALTFLDLAIIHFGCEVELAFHQLLVGVFNVLEVFALIERFFA
jgi:hypothetical protein